MAIWDTPENDRAWMTRETLHSLSQTVDFGRHRLFLVDNASTDPLTRELLDMAAGGGDVMVGEDLSGTKRWRIPKATVIRNRENVGTARAVNLGWLNREPFENAVKMDNDVVIKRAGWLDILEECVARDPQIGIIGLKRKDIEERPDHSYWFYKSELHMLPHQAGEKWLVIEKVHHAIGTCQLYNAAFLAKAGYLVQFGIYGLDDSAMAARVRAAGHYSAFYPGIEIDHIDPGGTDYTTWKTKYNGPHMGRFHEICNEYLDGKRSIYHGPSDNLE